MLRVNCFTWICLKWDEIINLGISSTQRWLGAQPPLPPALQTFCLRAAWLVLDRGGNWGVVFVWLSFCWGGGCESCKSTQSKNNLIAAGADHSRSTFQLIRFFFFHSFLRGKGGNLLKIFLQAACVWLLFSLQILLNSESIFVMILYPQRPVPQCYCCLTGGPLFGFNIYQGCNLQFYVIQTES